MNRDRAHLLYIQRCIANIQRIARSGKDAFWADEDKQAAVLFYLQTLSESTTRLDQTLRDLHPEIEWQKIRGFRNRVAHDYLGIDLELVWRIIMNELAPLASAVEVILASLPADEGDGEL